MNRKTLSANRHIGSRSIVLALYISTAFGLSAPAVLAQETTTTPNATATTEVRNYNIPVQPLSEALLQFEQQSGLQVTASSAMVKGKRATAVKGSLPAQQALSQLLAGTGLHYQISGGRVSLSADNEGAATLSADKGGAMTLPPVKISAGSIQGYPYGPEVSYVAKQSVTATKTDTPIIETPLSISVISRKEMDDRRVSNVGEAVSYTSGVSTGRTGTTALFGGNNIMIRGFGGGGTAGASFNEYLDGLRLPIASFVSANLDPWLLERVEVLKGPASVLYGQIQPGGIVNLISKRPHYGMSNALRLRTGKFDEFGIAFDLGGEFNDNWQARVVGLSLTGDTQQDHSKRDRQVVAPSLRWTNGTTDFILLTKYQHDDINASILSIIPRDGVFSNPHGRVPLSFRVGDPDFEKWDRTTWSLGYLFSHRFNDALTFRQNLRFTHNELDSNWIFRNSLEADQRTLNRRTFHAEEKADNWLLDNQLQWKFGTGPVQHTLLAGFNYRRYFQNNFATGGDAPSIDLFAPVYHQAIPRPTAPNRNNDFDVEQWGIYLQDQIKIGSLSILAGGRYSDSDITMEDHLEKTTTTEPADALTASAGIIYNFANGLAPYASYSESFEPVSGTTFGGSPFKPMEGKQYEVGVKYQPPGTTHLITLAAFHIMQENMLTIDPIHSNFQIQTGEVRTRGIELENKLSVNENLYVTAAYTYLDDKVTKSNDGNQGNRRAQIPKHSASLWANYWLPDGVLSGMGFGIGARYIGETEGDSGNTFSVPDYALVDFAFHYDLGRSPLALRGLRVDVNATNLLNNYYIASCFASHSCYLGQERAIRATLTYNWDWQ
jgi:iron complex outermembrane receptor protein